MIPLLGGLGSLAKTTASAQALGMNFGLAGHAMSGLGKAMNFAGAKNIGGKLQAAGQASKNFGGKVDKGFEAVMNAGPSVKLPFLRTPGKVTTQITDVKMPNGMTMQKAVKGREWKPYELTAGKALLHTGNAMLIGSAFKGHNQGTPNADTPDYPTPGAPNYQQQLKAAAARDFQLLLKYAEEHDDV